MELIFATANAHKLQEAAAILGPDYVLRGHKDLGYTGEIPETGSTFSENALQKARHIHKILGFPCFADDSGLEIDALDGAPGVHSARFAAAHDDLANLQKALRLMEGQAQRSARFRCVVAYIDAQGGEHLFEGKVEGRLLTAPEGEGGFGYDPIFRPAGYDRSFACLSPAEKNAISHRGRCMAAFKAFLEQGE